MLDLPVCVVIPNRNGREHLAYSLPSLARTTYPSYQVVMVDNCSTDNSCDYVAQNFPWVNIIRNPVDRGFAGGANVGIRWALAQGTQYIALFSNDIKVVPGWLEPVLEILTANKDVAVVGYTEVVRGSEAQIMMPPEVRFFDSSGRLPGPLYVCRSDIFHMAGLFDEVYFMYGEESDFFARVQRAGYRIVQTNIPVWHYGGGFTQQARFKVAWLSYRNGIRYAVKNESVLGILRQAVGLLYYGAIPTLRPASENWLARALQRQSVAPLSEIDLVQFRIKMQRLRPAHPIVNACMWMAAVGWNVLFVAPTLAARHRDNSRVQRALFRTSGLNSDAV